MRHQAHAQNSGIDCNCYCLSLPLPVPMLCVLLSLFVVSYMVFRVPVAGLQGGLGLKWQW
jgi:hypothetical protein